MTALRFASGIEETGLTHEHVPLFVLLLYNSLLLSKHAPTPNVGGYCYTWISSDMWCTVWTAEMAKASAMTIDVHYSTMYKIKQVEAAMLYRIIL